MIKKVAIFFFLIIVIPQVSSISGVIGPCVNTDPELSGDIGSRTIDFIQGDKCELSYIVNDEEDQQCEVDTLLKVRQYLNSRSVFTHLEKPEYNKLVDIFMYQPRSNKNTLSRTVFSEAFDSATGKKNGKCTLCDQKNTSEETQVTIKTVNSICPNSGEVIALGSIKYETKKVKIGYVPGDIFKLAPITGWAHGVIEVKRQFDPSTCSIIGEKKFRLKSFGPGIALQQVRDGIKEAIQKSNFRLLRRSEIRILQKLIDRRFKKDKSTITSTLCGDSLTIKVCEVNDRRCESVNFNLKGRNINRELLTPDPVPTQGDAFSISLWTTGPEITGEAAVQAEYNRFVVGKFNDMKDIYNNAASCLCSGFKPL